MLSYYELLEYLSSSQWHRDDSQLTEEELILTAKLISANTIIGHLNLSSITYKINTRSF